MDCEVGARDKRKIGEVISAREQTHMYLLMVLLHDQRTQRGLHVFLLFKFDGWCAPWLNMRPRALVGLGTPNTGVSWT